MKLKFYLFFPLMILPFSAVWADRKVETVGVALYDPDNLANVRQAALLDAQKNAVEQVMGVYVKAETRVEKSLIIEDKILTNSRGYVKKYEVIKEWAEGNFYKVRIRAVVAEKELQSELVSLGLYRYQKEKLNIFFLNRHRFMKPSTDVTQLGGGLKYYPLENSFVEVDFALTPAEVELQRTGKTRWHYGLRTIRMSQKTFNIILGQRLLNLNKVNVGLMAGVEFNVFELTSQPSGNDVFFGDVVEFMSSQRIDLQVGPNFEFHLTNRFSIGGEIGYNTLSSISIGSFDIEFIPVVGQIKLVFYL